MKIVHKKQTKQVQNSKNCIAVEYPLGDIDINGTIIELSGREPDSGRAMNMKCKELAYVINGTGKVVIDDKVINLKQGDLVLIEPEEEFFWEGNMTIFMPCTPAWRPDQYRKVE
jgi:mannose-6-phosphate isomerase-like protein (cupin superfamily)